MKPRRPVRPIPAAVFSDTALTVDQPLPAPKGWRMPVFVPLPDGWPQ